MKFETLLAAAEIYETAGNPEISRVTAESEAVSKFAKSLEQLERAVRDYRDDDYWGRTSRLLRRRRFAIYATPLPFAHPALDILGTVAVVRQLLERCAALYPEFESVATAACDALMGVFLSRQDPLSDAIVNAAIAFEADRLGVVVVSFGFDRAVQQHLRTRLGGADDIDAVTPRELAARRPYDTLFVVGSPYWYSRKGWEWVFTAPRGAQLIVVGYPAQSGHDLPSRQAFSHSRMAIDSLPRTPQQGLVTSQTQLENDDDVEFDWDFMPTEIARRAAAASPAELADARLHLLADGFATFLHGSEDSRVQVLDPDAPGGQRIVSVAPSEITPGSFVLLRLQGGGDLVVVVADAILGDRAVALRAMQAEWKAGLRDRVEARGVAAVIAELKAHGSARANRGNLGNWCSPRSLRTEDLVDFAAILKTIGLGDKVEHYWKAMGQLDRAHRRAGFEIREQLEEQAEQADLSLLETAGRTDFTLPQGGGTLTAFRVEEISPQVVKVPYQELGEPFEARA